MLDRLNEKERRAIRGAMEALETAIRYAEAERVPAGKTRDDMYLKLQTARVTLGGLGGWEGDE